MYILQVIQSAYKILNTLGQSYFIPLQIFFLFSAFIQVVGVVSIAPFIGILSNPDTIHTNSILSSLYTTLNFSSDRDFIISFSFLSLFLIFFSNLITGVTLWLSFQFSILIGNSLQSRLFSNLLKRPYLFHKTTDHTKIIALVNQETPRFVYMVVQPLLILFSQTLVALVILIGLFILDPVIAFSAGLVVGGSYLLTYVFLRRNLKRHGKIVSERNEGVQAILSEAFLGVKEIKLGGIENNYTEKFSHINRRGLASTSFLVLAGDIPKLVIETISFGAILILAVVLLLSETDSGEAIALLSLYSLAGYKLLPTMQQMYRSVSNISANGQVVSKINYELSQPIDDTGAPATSGHSALSIDTISLTNITFTYPNSLKPAINNISLNFKKGTLNTIAGPSGSGKSTLADITLGLLIPDSGFLAINDEMITNDTLPIYKNQIGYVPQHIFLTNDSLLANVAFGEAHADIERVQRALQLANADTFASNLPDGIYTNLGQDGKLLSGGQRQRVGIARALYRNSSILVLDEPTSALDIESEHDLMTTLKSLKNDVLIIIISHRPTAIKMSDNITIIDDGTVVANGAYDELIKSDQIFRKLMKITTHKKENEDSSEVASK